MAPAQEPVARVALLAAAVARGDQAALADLYRTKLPMVLSAARRFTGRDESFGLDIAQETFLRVIAARSSLARIATEADLDRWLIAITRSAAIDLLRRELRNAKREQARGERGSSDPTDDDRDAQAATIYKLLSQLESESHDAVRMRTNGSTLGQIATALGTTVGSVHGRIRRAMQVLSSHHRESDHE